MLSERERRELELIERELGFDDPRFAAALRRGFAGRCGGFAGRFRRQLYRPRSVILFGVLLMAAALFLELGDTFLQGMIVTAAGATWWLWNTRESPKGRPRGTTSGGN